MKSMKKALSLLLALVMCLSLLPVSAFAYDTYDSHVTLNAGDGSPTGVKMSVGDTWDGWTVTAISQTSVTFRKTGQHNNNFTVPAPGDIWYGVSHDYKTVATYSSAWNGDKHIGAQAQILYTGGSATYKNVINIGSGGGSTTGISFTVKHQYYTNGNLDGEYPETQNFSSPLYTGDWYPSNNVTKIYIYGGNSYTYTSVSPSSIYLAKGATGDKGILTVRYDRAVQTTKYNYQLTWDYNGGTVGSDGSRTNTVNDQTESTYTFYEDAQGYGSPRPERNGYTFTGWIYSGDGSFNSSNGQINMNGVANGTASGTLTAQWKQNAPTDNGNGISITKTRASINDDQSKTTAEPGDEITWNITVTNNSNVTKTVTLTEQLLGAYFTSTNTGTMQVALPPNESQTVTAKYTVKNVDSGTLHNTVKASTGDPGSNENPSAVDGGTQIGTSPVRVTVTWVDEDGTTILDGPKTFNKGGTEPTTNVTPTKPADDKNTYAFDKWERTEDGDGNVTYRATYTATPKAKVTASWLNGYSEAPKNVIETKTVDRDISDADLKTLYPVAPTRDGWTFVKWGDPVRDIDGNITITAQWKENGGISVEKTVHDGNPTRVKVGDTVTWDIKVTNNFAEEKTINLAEQLTGAALSKNSVTLAAGTSETVTATYMVKDGDAGQRLKNTVKATVEGSGVEETAENNDIEVEAVRIPRMKITKTNNGFKYDGNKATIDYTIQVTNQSGFPVYNFDLGDVLETKLYATGTENQVGAEDGVVVNMTYSTATWSLGSTNQGELVPMTGDGYSDNAPVVNSTSTRRWHIMDTMLNGQTVAIQYTVTIEVESAAIGFEPKLHNVATYYVDVTAPSGVNAQQLDEFTFMVQAPRFFGLTNMFAQEFSGSSDEDAAGVVDGNTGSASSDASGSFGPTGGGTNPDNPNPDNPNPDNPNPDPGPVDIPDDPTPLNPTPNNPPEVEIDDERTPLASANGLNSVDHFAYIIGYSDDTVRPENKITRAEVATIFFRLMTDVYRAANWSTTNDFSDVAAGSWYNNAISTCAKAGLVNGYSDGTFKPDQSITRAEFATIAARFLDEEITGAGAEGFADIEGHWAETNILRAAEAGWVNGDNGRFRPDDYISRAEVMTIVNRMLNRVPDADHMLPEMKTWSDNPKTAWYYEAVQEATNEHAYEWIDENVENWTELLTVRDWAALEKEWATEYSAED